jgi:hypothetical protein
MSNYFHTTNDTFNFAIVKFWNSVVFGGSENKPLVLHQASSIYVSGSFMRY